MIFNQIMRKITLFPLHLHLHRIINNKLFRFLLYRLIKLKNNHVCACCFIIIIKIYLYNTNACCWGKPLIRVDLLPLPQSMVIIYKDVQDNRYLTWINNYIVTKLTLLCSLRSIKFLTHVKYNVNNDKHVFRLLP